MMQQHEDVKTMFYVFSQQMKELTPHICTLWKYDQIDGFMQRQLMGSYSKKMFWQCAMLNFYTFEFCVKQIFATQTHPFHINNSFGD
jgi:hypothetical protein